MPNQPPTTRAYPQVIGAPVPAALAIEIYNLAWALDKSKNDAVRAVLEAGLLALSPLYRKEREHAQ